MKKTRCPWAKSENDIIYHDTEWGVPSHDDNYLFEMLILEGFQAGLSWNLILNKRENFRTAFDNFDYNKIINYDGSHLFATDFISSTAKKLNPDLTDDEKAYIERMYYRNTLSISRLRQILD